ncbi:MAG: hypothetical protein U0559_05405 [Anaerolineae bacterium]
MRVPLTVVADLDEAEIVVTVKNYYRKRPKMINLGLKERRRYMCCAPAWLCRSTSSSAICLV